MNISSQLKGGIYEVSFGYNPKMEGYTTLMSDIPKLYDICLRTQKKKKLLYDAPLGGFI